MWIKINNRLLNLERATDVGLRKESVTVYFGNDEYWSTKYDTLQEAEDTFNAIMTLTDAKDVKRAVDFLKMDTYTTHN